MELSLVKIGIFSMGVWINWMNIKKANKQEMELRAGFAADLLAQGHSCTVVTTRVTEEYE